ncbi:MAG: biosynthetic-type acetolactate synthase large subunit [Victivallales bacterium]|nr:biosynthetic-type acetolactate synthase large subunit [Victivallales bacterium]
MKQPSSENKTGARIVAEALKREGVEYVFAYPGATSMPLHQALSDEKVKVILPRHEQGGAFAAGGYARRTGHPGVCMATSGPGATNLVTGIADAYMDSIALVVITAQVDQHLIGKNAFQETDIIGMTRLCVKHSYLVLDIRDLAQTLTDAFYLVTHGRPGPVVIDIPWDVLHATCVPEFKGKASLLCLEERHVPTESSVDELYRMLKVCKRPVLYVGGGAVAANVSKEVRAFAERNRLPLTSSLMGIGTLAWDHPLNLRWLGMHGAYAANRAVNECDLLIGLGVRFSDRVTGNINAFAPHAKIVHVDIDNSEINKNKHTDFALVCDVRELLVKLLEKPVLPTRKAWLKQLDEWKAEHPFGVATGGTKGLIGPDVIQMLYKMTNGSATIVTGVGQHQMWAAQFYGMSKPRHLLTSGGLGAMGFGLPTAIGAQMAKPDDTVILIDGDGSFQMNIQELATVYCQSLPLKMVILDNQLLGMVAQWQDIFYDGRHTDTDLAVPKARRPYPDFVSIAKGYMIPGLEVSTTKELEPAIRKMLKTPGPFLLDVHIVPNEHVLPMIPAGKTCEEIILS